MKELPQCRVVFVESLCDDEQVIERNLRQKIAMSPDYAAKPFAEALARKMGRLLRGGEPDVRTVAVQMINDWQRGKLPHFVPPPAAAAGDGEAPGEPEAAADDLAALEDANEAAAQTALDSEAA